MESEMLHLLDDYPLQDHEGGKAPNAPVLWAYAKCESLILSLFYRLMGVSFGKNLEPYLLVNRFFEHSPPAFSSVKPRVEYVEHQGMCLSKGNTENEQLRLPIGNNLKTMYSTGKCCIRNAGKEHLSFTLIAADIHLQSLSGTCALSASSHSALGA